MLLPQRETNWSSAAFDACPFGETETNICLASLSSMVIGASNRQVYCATDNYDNCPIFLARILRRR
jgi:hypothetical protein